MESLASAIQIFRSLKVPEYLIKVAIDISFVLGQTAHVHLLYELQIFAQSIIDSLSSFKDQQYVHVNVKDCLLVVGDIWIIKALNSIGISIQVSIGINHKNPTKVYTKVLLYRKGTEIDDNFSASDDALQILEEIAETDKVYHDTIDNESVLYHDELNGALQKFDNLLEDEVQFIEFHDKEGDIAEEQRLFILNQFNPEDPQWIENNKFHTNWLIQHHIL